MASIPGPHKHLKYGLWGGSQGVDAITDGWLKLDFVFVKENLIRPISSSATSNSSQSVSCIGTQISFKPVKTTFCPPGIMEFRLCLSALCVWYCEQAYISFAHAHFLHTCCASVVLHQLICFALCRERFLYDILY